MVFTPKRRVCMDRENTKTDYRNLLQHKRENYNNLSMQKMQIVT